MYHSEDTRDRAKALAESIMAELKKRGFKGTLHADTYDGLEIKLQYAKAHIDEDMRDSISIRNRILSGKLIVVLDTVYGLSRITPRLTLPESTKDLALRTANHLIERDAYAKSRKEQLAAEAKTAASLEEEYKQLRKKYPRLVDFLPTQLDYIHKHVEFQVRLPPEKMDQFLALLPEEVIILLMDTSNVDEEPMPPMFTCPSCGFHEFGTANPSLDLSSATGCCHGPGCHFTWPRSEDDKYFTGTPESGVVVTARYESTIE